MKNRWMMNRIGLINFWYYDKEEFQFSNGRLLLRGSNGSGKSVTMQSFIPLLLDGNKSPERLDPFGSRARKIENYLLGEEDDGREERTGYLYMEFKRENTENYLTIGLGLRARKGKPLDSWGFSIIDGRRIGIDFLLYKEIGEDIPLTKTELKNRIGDGGEVREGQKDYMSMVNNLLFGFENIEEYDELIKLLVQLRTPKLSKDFKPTVIYEIMNNALQPLSDEDLRPMSEAIENMDNIKTQLETLKLNKKSADRIKNAYDQYNQYILFEKSKNILKTNDELNKLYKTRNNLENETLQLEKQYNDANEKIGQLEIEEKGYKEKEAVLRKHDSFTLKKQIASIEETISEDKKYKENKAILIDKKRTEERNLNTGIKKVEEEEESKVHSVENILEEMQDSSSNFYFTEQIYLEKEILENIRSPYDFTYVDNQFKNYYDRITKSYELIQEQDRSAKNYDASLEKLEKTKKEEESVVTDLNKAQQMFLEIKEEFVEKMYTWEKNNINLKISREDLVEATQKIYLYGDKSTFDDILSSIRTKYSVYESKYKGEISKLDFKKEQLDGKINEKEKELLEWKNKKDPEPERPNKVLRNRARLKEMNIPCTPFYMAVDFERDIPEETKGIFEEALLDMGILDALIVPKKYQAKVFAMDQDMADRYIFEDPQYLRHELSQLLKVEKSKDLDISGEEISSILKSILLDNDGGNSFINEKGEYGIGIIRGKVTHEYRAKFIGIQARKQYREEMIEQLDTEINEIENEIKIVEEHIEFYNDKLKILSSEMSTFPKKDDLEVALKQVEKLNLQHQHVRNEVEKRENEKIKDYEELQVLRKKVWDLTQGLRIPINGQAFKEALEEANLYKEQKHELKTAHQSLLDLMKRKELLLDQYEGLLEDMDDLLYDLNRLERKIKEDVSRLENFKEQLKMTNYEDVQREIEDCINRLSEIPKEKENAIAEREAGKIQSEHKKNLLTEIHRTISLQEKLYEIYKEYFIKELSLSHMPNIDEKKDMNLIAKDILDHSVVIDRAGKSKEDYSESLQEKHHANRQYLVEYNLSMGHIFDDSVEGLEDEAIKDAIGKQKRLEIKGKIQGKEVDFYNLLKFIDEAIDENEKLLQESDRQLFEDILANTISKKIRAKIYHSDRWVDKMNQLMEGMNTSSGLSFSLVWKHKKGETEEQLDTKELVELLKRDSSLLKPGDLKKLSNHFQSKILEARKRSEEISSYESFHNIMKDVLDYRKWFEFQLWYKKTGEPKKELTNNAFDKFSGGEKAMAMYVPLFSSVYARYEGANKDCPRIISLDEAFAGVDENNIRDMFKLIEELDLNFIMNSQILWGDYDTVKSLSICELIRPNNAKFVTVIRYLWNGKVKELVIDEVKEDV